MEVIESGLLHTVDCTLNILAKAVFETFSVSALRFGPLTFAASAPYEAKAGKNCRRFVAQLETISSSLPIALSPSFPSWVVARPSAAALRINFYSLLVLMRLSLR